MANLLSLPTELIQNVLQRVMPTPDSWTRGRRQASQTCRVLHSIATTLLYSRYEALTFSGSNY
jgi:hypothetical protein